MNFKSKTIILLTAICGFFLPVNAQEAADTIAVLHNASSVILTSEGGKSSEITVEVSSSGVRPAYTYRYSSKVTEPGDPAEVSHGDSLNLDLPFMHAALRPAHKVCYTFWGRDVHVGAMVPVDNAPGLKAGWELGIGKIAGIGVRPFRGGPSLELGIGMVYRCMKLDDSHVFGSDDRGILYIEPLPEGCHKPSSRLDMWAMRIPLAIRQKLCGSFHVEAGVGMTLCFSSKATRNYRSIDGTMKYSQTLKQLHQRNVGMDLRLAFGWDEILGLYVSYSPVSVFSSGLGPKSDFICAGVSLGF